MRYWTRVIQFSGVSFAPDQNRPLHSFSESMFLNAMMKLYKLYMRVKVKIGLNDTTIVFIGKYDTNTFYHTVISHVSAGPHFPFSPSGTSLHATATAKRTPNGVWYLPTPLGAHLSITEYDTRHIVCVFVYVRACFCVRVHVLHSLSLDHIVE